MGNRGNGAAASIPWRSSTGATGTPAADEAGDQLVAGLGGDGLSRRPAGARRPAGTARRSPRAATSASPSSAHRPAQKCCSFMTPKRHLPAVLRCEEPVARNERRAGAGRLVAPSGRLAPAGPVQVASTSVMEMSR